MFYFCADVVSLVCLTLCALLALDYLFGTSKFSSINAVLQNPPILIAFCAISACGAVLWLSHLMNWKIVVDITTFYVSICWILLWLYYTIVYAIEGVVKFRNYNLMKRRKPL